MNRKNAACVSLLVCLTAGCAAGESAADRVVTRDSAGIEIVENRVGSWSEGNRWRIGAEPVVDIGVLEGAPEYQLFRVSDARRFADGRIVVVNGGTGELRFYDAHGRYLASAGRRGGGPGEFERMGWMRLYRGDSLLVYDFDQARVSIFDGEGRFGRSFRLQPPGESGFVMGLDVFADGSVLARAPRLFFDEMTDGYMRPDEVYHVYSPAGSFVDSIGSFPGPEQFLRTGGDGQRRFVSIMTLPFGRSSSAVAHGDRFLFGSGDAYEIAAYGMDGRLVRLIRKAWTAPLVTDEALERFVAHRMAEAPNDEARRGIEETYAALPIPKTMPAFRDLEIDALGNLWVRDFEPDEDAERPWSVFTPAGHLLGTLLLPAGLGVTQIGDDFILGAWRDDLDVEHVRLYRLDRGTR